MQSRNTRIAHQTMYLGEYARLVVRGIEARPVRLDLAKNRIYSMVDQRRMPAVVRLAAYLSLGKDILPTFNDDAHFEMFLRPDPDESDYHRVALGRRYASEWAEASRATESFARIHTKDFHLFGENLVNAFGTIKATAVQSLVDDLEKIVRSSEYLVSFQTLP